MRNRGRRAAADGESIREIGRLKLCRLFEPLHRFVSRHEGLVLPIREVETRSLEPSPRQSNYFRKWLPQKNTSPAVSTNSLWTSWFLVKNRCGPTSKWLPSNMVVRDMPPTTPRRSKTDTFAPWPTAS